MSTERLPVLYIAGPYRAATPWRILNNIRHAQDVALQIWRRGAVALCPHANTALFDHEMPDAIWLDGDLELIRRSDAVVMVTGWQASTGASAERDFAKELRLPVFDTTDFGVNYDVIGRWIDVWKVNRRAESLRRTALRSSVFEGPYEG